MTLIKAVNGIYPVFGKNCYLAENATIVGDVKFGDDCSVWFNAVIRGDVNTIVIGHTVNVQDGAIIHCTYQKAATTIGNFVSIGHHALIHGCTIHDFVLIGMGAIIMDNAVVEANAIVAAGAVVLENTIVESGAIYAGIPARRVKTLGESQTKEFNEKIARNYVMYKSWYD